MQGDLEEHAGRFEVAQGKLLGAGAGWRGLEGLCGFITREGIPGWPRKFVAEAETTRPNSPSPKVSWEGRKIKKR